MRLLPLAALTAFAVIIALSASGAERSQASNPPAAAIPILDCTDVNGDGSVTVADIAQVVGKFGTSTGGAGYHPLYDVGSPVGSVTAGDLGAAVLDFGKSNDGDGDVNDGDTCPEMDTEIAQATLWVVRDHPGLLTLDVDLLASLGYVNSSIDVPGQGVHYTNRDLWDGVFEPTAPEGLVYIDGNDGARLVAQLYYVDGDVVGWGPNPDPEHTNIDPFCLPAPPNVNCSWAGPQDTWHFHINLCTIHIGTNHASNTFTSTAEECEQLNAGDGDWAWADRVGWMGHLWVHFANPNGRFADCFPDGGIWKAYNCPQ